MKIHIPHRFLRVLGWLSVCFGLFMGVTLAIGVLATDGQWWAAPIALLCCCALGGLLGFTYLNHAPKLEITPEGVWAKRFFCTRFYAWDVFIQAGVDWRRNRGRLFHEIVLLLPGGSKRKKYDMLFYAHNARYILYLPYRDDVLIYLLQGYGKLDFCFLNGSEKEEYYTINEELQ